MFRCRRELGAVLALALCVAHARAEPAAPAVEPFAARAFLELERGAAASSCIAREPLARAVEARLGRPVFVAQGEADLRVQVRARRQGGRFQMDVTLFDRRGQLLGERQLSTAAGHCSALDDSLALVISLAADMPGLRPSPPPEPPVPAVPPAPARPGTPSPAPPATPLAIPADTFPPRLGVRLEPSAGLAVLAGPAPGATLAFELGVTLRAGRFWPVSLRARGWLPRTHRFGPGRGATFSGRALELGICPWEGRLGELAVQACVLEWFGRVNARGFGFDEDDRGDRWLLALGGGVSLGRRFGGLLASVGGGLLAPLPRRRYFFTDVSGATTSLYDEPWVYGAVVVRLGTEF